ncbi:SRPBCC family protein [Streptomyces sp. NPDC006602]|uniref:SRPBCC family protein n=1 Tax=Streptomyces sp. NPDC006602 TaxID=3364751 RepID=UPI00367553BF
MFSLWLACAASASNFWLPNSVVSTHVETMRLADARVEYVTELADARVEYVTEIAAAPQRVWDLVSDIATSARHSPELQEVEWLDGAEGPAVGACFSGRNRNSGLGEWRTVSRVAQLSQERVFQWEVVHYNDRRPRRAAGRLDVHPGTARRRLRQPPAARHALRLGPRPMHEVVERYPDREEQIIDGRLALLRTGIEQALAGVKAEAEAQSEITAYGTTQRDRSSNAYGPGTGGCCVQRAGMNSA